MRINVQFSNAHSVVRQLASNMEDQITWSRGCIVVDVNHNNETDNNCTLEMGRGTRKTIVHGIGSEVVLVETTSGCPGGDDCSNNKTEESTNAGPPP